MEMGRKLGARQVERLKMALMVCVLTAYILS
jgi:hypothetical protein